MRQHTNRMAAAVPRQPESASIPRSGFGYSTQRQVVQIVSRQVDPTSVDQTLPTVIGGALACGNARSSIHQFSVAGKLRGSPAQSASRLKCADISGSPGEIRGWKIPGVCVVHRFTWWEPEARQLVSRSSNKAPELSSGKQCLVGVSRSAPGSIEGSPRGPIAAPALRRRPSITRSRRPVKPWFGDGQRADRGRRRSQARRAAAGRTCGIADPHPIDPGAGSGRLRPHAQLVENGLHVRLGAGPMRRRLRRMLLGVRGA